MEKKLANSLRSSGIYGVLYMSHYPIEIGPMKNK